MEQERELGGMAGETGQQETLARAGKGLPRVEQVQDERARRQKVESSRGLEKALVHKLRPLYRIGRASPSVAARGGGRVQTRPRSVRTGSRVF